MAKKTKPKRKAPRAVSKPNPEMVPMDLEAAEERVLSGMPSREIRRPHRLSFNISFSPETGHFNLDGHSE